MRRLSVGIILPAFALIVLAPAVLHAETGRKLEAKREAASRPFRPDYRLLSSIPETEPNDSVSQAQPFACGDELGPASVEARAVPDTDWITFTVNAGDVITFGTDSARVDPEVADTRIDLLAQDGVTVLARDDDSGPDFYSLITFCATYTGTYYGRIASYSTEVGNYVAYVTCVPSSVANDQCFGAIPITCGPFALQGNTVDVCADYTLPANDSSCTRFAANGRDVAYYVDVSAGNRIAIDYSQIDADASIYIITDCAHPAASCVAGKDSSSTGGVETLRYRFHAAGRYYIILDSFAAGTGGPWTASGELFCTTTDVPMTAASDGWLQAAAPNPSPGPFSFRFALPRATRGSLAICDPSGRRVRELLSGPLSAGEHTVTWDGRDERRGVAPNGVYFYRLRTDERVFSRMLVMLR